MRPRVLELPAQDQAFLKADDPMDRVQPLRGLDDLPSPKVNYRDLEPGARTRNRGVHIPARLFDEDL